MKFEVLNFLSQPLRKGWDVVTRPGPMTRYGNTLTEGRVFNNCCQDFTVQSKKTSRTTLAAIRTALISIT